MSTKIEWTQETWNPIVGCSKVSPGCANCYAERMAKRLKAMGRLEYQQVINRNGKWTGKVVLVPERLEQPLRWRKPRMVFVNSMSDLFHEDVPYSFITKIMNVIEEADRHTFQILTKRPERILDWSLYDNPDLREPDFPSNLWLGVSVEDQKTVDERIPWLLKTPAAVRFVSAEPLLNRIDLLPNLSLIDWVIAGCESGPNRREVDFDFFRSLKDQCQDARIPFFLKQADSGGKVVKMPELDGRVWDQFPNST